MQLAMKRCQLHFFLYGVRLSLDIELKYIMLDNFLVMQRGKGSARIVNVKESVGQETAI